MIKLPEIGAADHIFNRSAHSAFQFIHQVGIFLHGAFPALPLEGDPGFIFGLGYEVEWVGRTFRAGITCRGLLVEGIQLEQGVVAGTIAEALTVFYRSLEQFLQISSRHTRDFR